MFTEASKRATEEKYIPNMRVTTMHSWTGKYYHFLLHRALETTHFTIMYWAGKCLAETVSEKTVGLLPCKENMRKHSQGKSLPS